MVINQCRTGTQLVSRNPLGDLEEHFNRLFNEPIAPLSGWISRSREWTPALDVSETDEAYHIEADLPGVDKDQLKIEVLEDIVTIKGERHAASKEERKGYHRSERTYGAFQRTVRIPGGFRNDAVEASFDGGVLKLTLPKLEESRPRLIDVKVAKNKK